MKYFTKTKWESLNDKEQWDVKVALRGPDCHNSETVKYYTTAVIRAACSKVFRVGGTVNPDLNMVILPRWEYGAKKTIPIWANQPMSWNYAHFLQHIEEASGILSIPVMWSPAEAWFKAWEQRHPLHGLGVILGGLNPEDKTSDLGKELQVFLEAHLGKAVQW